LENAYFPGEDELLDEYDIDDWLDYDDEELELIAIWKEKKKIKEAIVVDAWIGSADTRNDRYENYAILTAQLRNGRKNVIGGGKEEKEREVPWVSGTFY